MDLTATEAWIYPVQDKDQQSAFVNTVVSLLIPKDARNVLTS